MENQNENQLENQIAIKTEKNSTRKKAIVITSIIVAAIVCMSLIFVVGSNNKKRVAFNFEAKMCAYMSVMLEAGQAYIDEEITGLEFSYVQEEVYNNIKELKVPKDKDIENALASYNLASLDYIIKVLEAETILGSKHEYTDDAFLKYIDYSQRLLDKLLILDKEYELDLKLDSDAVQDEVYRIKRNLNFII